MNLKRGETYVIKVSHLPENNNDDQIEVIFEGETRCERGVLKNFRSKRGGYMITYTHPQWILCICKTLNGEDVEKKFTDEMVSVKEASAIFGIDLSVIRKMCRKGKIRGVMMENNAWRVPLSSIEEMRRERERKKPMKAIDALRPYQMAALKKIEDRAKKNRGTMVALDMGTGKTLTAISVAISKCADEGRFLRVLVLAPVAVLTAWEAEIDTWCYGVHASCFIEERTVSGAKKGGKTVDKLKKYLHIVDKKRDVDAPSLDFIILNYETAKTTDVQNLLMETHFDVIIADESHKCKGVSSAQGKLLRRLAIKQKSAWKMCLTGTPLPHSPLDAWSQFAFLDSTIYGSSYTAFRTRYAEMGGYGGHEIKGWKNMEDFQRKFHDASIVVSRHDVLDLPPTTFIEREFLLSKKEADMYKSMENYFVAIVQSAISDSDGKEKMIVAVNVLSKMLRLSQITGGHLPDVDDDQKVDSTGKYHQIGDSKLNALADVLDEIGPNEPVVIFSRFTAEIASIKERCESIGRKCFELSGHRNELDWWKSSIREGQKGCTLVTQESRGGVGVSFVESRYCIYYSVGYSLGNFEQSVARTHRHGQERPTTFVFLIAQRESGRPTIDKLICNAIAKRKAVIDDITSRRGAIQGGCDRYGMVNVLKEKVKGMDPEAAAIIEGIIMEANE